MRKGKKVSLLAIGALLVAYTAVACSPIRDEIGRSSPAAASLFSPPLLNFSHTYIRGNVLDFRVGMTKDEVFRKLTEKYSDQADLTINCVVTIAASVVAITRDLDIGAVYGGGPRLCVRLDSRRLVVKFDFDEEVVSAINVKFLRTRI